jgi:hypothetical protein
VVGAEILVEGAVAQHVVGGGQDRGGDGADGLLGSAPLAQALELRPEIAVPLVAGGPGALHKDGFQPRCALAQPFQLPTSGARKFAAIARRESGLIPCSAPIRERGDGRGGAYVA